MHPISLHHIVTPDVDAIRLVEIAAETGYEMVCLVAQIPTSGWDFPVVEAAQMPALQAALKAHGIEVYAVTSFPVQPEIDVASYKPALERSGELGARFVSVRIDDPDKARAADSFARLGEIAGQFGIVPSIEFMGFDKPDLLADTLEVLDRAGCGTLTLDPLHIMRSGTTLEAMAAAKDRIGYVQLCDGKLAGTAENYLYEAGCDRLPPGEGEFPMFEMLELVSEESPVSLEVPMQPLAHLPPEDRAVKALHSTRTLLQLFAESRS